MTLSTPWGATNVVSYEYSCNTSTRNPKSNFGVWLAFGTPIRAVGLLLTLFFFFFFIANYLLKFRLTEYLTPKYQKFDFTP